MLFSNNIYHYGQQSAAFIATFKNEGVRLGEPICAKVGIVMTKNKGLQACRSQFYGDFIQMR